MFGLLVLVGLFVALTPGILFRLKGSKKVSAAMHAVLFAVVLYVVCMYGPSYGVRIEGFQNSGCPGGTTFDSISNKCKGFILASCNNGTLSATNGKKCIKSGQVVGDSYCPSYADKPTPDNSGNCVVYTPAPAPSAAASSSAAPGIAAKSLVFCNKQLNQVFEVISVNPNKTLTVTDATAQQKGTGTMQTANCELITNYIGKEVNCNRSTGTNVIVKNVRRDAYFEVYAKKTPNNVQAIPPGTCVIVPTIVGTITSAITGK